YRRLAYGARARCTLLCVPATCPPRGLHSFPTRRSSDLESGARSDDVRAGSTVPRVRAGGEQGLCHAGPPCGAPAPGVQQHSPALDRKSTRLNSSHVKISYAVFCVKKKSNTHHIDDVDDG